MSAILSNPHDSHALNPSDSKVVDHIPVYISIVERLLNSPDKFSLNLAPNFSTFVLSCCAILSAILFACTLDTEPEGAKPNTSSSSSEVDEVEG